MTTISLRLPHEELSALDRQAGELGMDRTSFIRMALREATRPAAPRARRWKATEWIGRFDLAATSDNASARAALARHANQGR